MTEEQKRKLERQANNYSFNFYDRRKNGCSVEVLNTMFIALSLAIQALGYELVTDGEDEILGVRYSKYKIVEIKELK